MKGFFNRKFLFRNCRFALRLLICRNFIYSKAVIKIDDKNDDMFWKESVKSNYNKRIRNLSSVEKVFNVFASIHKEGDPIWVRYMTIEDFINSLVPIDSDVFFRKGTFVKRELQRIF